MMLVKILEPITTKQGTLKPGQLVDLSPVVIQRLAGKVRPIKAVQTPVAPLPQWQYDFCTAHSFFNGWRGQCPKSIDDCLISRLIDAKGDLEALRPVEVVQGVTFGAVLALCQGEQNEAYLRKHPVDFVLVAGSIAGCNHD